MIWRDTVCANKRLQMDVARAAQLCAARSSHFRTQSVIAYHATEAGVSLEKRKSMRLVFALIYMVLGMWAYLSLGGDGLHPYWGIGFAFFLMFSSVIVCNEGFLQKVRGQSDDDYINQLLEQKKASIESYKAQEAFTLEDQNTGCLCHIVRVSEDKVICLYGQYLYEYSETTDDEEENQERKFPTSEFKVIRRVKDKKVLRLEIGNSIIPERIIAGEKINQLYEFGFKLTDGEIVQIQNYPEFRSSLVEQANKAL